MSVIDFAFALLFFRIYCCYLPPPHFHRIYVFVCVGRYGLGRNRVAHGNSGTACSRVRSWGYNKIKRLASQHPAKHHSQQQPPVLSSALMPMRNDVDGAKVEEEEEVYTYVHMETHDIAI